jgi:type IV secretion system protein TrbL
VERFLTMLGQRLRRLLSIGAVALIASTVLMLLLAAPAPAILGCAVNPACIVGKAVGGGISAVAGDAITALAEAVLGALSHAIEWASTLWVGVGTPSVADGAGQSTGTVSFLQQNLLVYTTGLAVLSTLIGAGRIVCHEHKAAHARELVRFLATYALVSAGAATAASVLIGGADQMAAWFISQADANSNFSTHLAQLLGITGQSGGFTAGLAATATTAVIAIVLGLLAFLGSVIQVMLMLVRGGMLVLLVGTLPLIAAFSNTEMGNQWFRKAVAWLLAFALYKPAAAIIYAVAFDLGGQQGALALLDGVMMLILAILALPALLRFLVPATSALAAGGGTGVMLAGGAGAAAMRMPSGAAPIQSATSTSYQHGQAGSTSATGAASAAGHSAGGGPGLVGAGGTRARPGAASSTIAGPGDSPGARGPGGQAGATGAAGRQAGGAASGAATAASGGAGAAAAIGAQQLAKGAASAHNAGDNAASGDEQPSSSSDPGPSGSDGTRTYRGR